ncbi:transposase [Rhodococcus koreensis]|uniref:transposase n=1 Tax=Rhodococcus koreensis TaxID=99653 RepID=UPI0036DC7924
MHRFADAAHLCSWAGLTPKHRESDTVVRRGHITPSVSTSAPEFRPLRRCHGVVARRHAELSRKACRFASSAR